MLRKIQHHFLAMRVHTGKSHRPFSERLHIDVPLLLGILLLMSVGLIILYSASSQDSTVIFHQLLRFCLALICLFVFAQISPVQYRLWTPWLFGLGVFLLIIVLSTGYISKGAQRWINLGFMRFQPSEMMKLLVPIMLAWYLDAHELPPRLGTLFKCMLIIFIPTLLVAKQPDLGTALLIAFSGIGSLLCAGLRIPVIIAGVLSFVGSIPLVWHFMHAYQRQRVLTFLDPERDPLGSGYHIIQSKIAIGSGGIFGKGWLHGTQSHLHFLPEHATDFIFAVVGEEFGFFGAIVLIGIYLYIIGRCLYISLSGQDIFSRLLCGGLTLIFFLSIFINIGMVIGILPVVGVPLPLVSYGGTSVVTSMAGFGIMMSLHTHRKLLST